MKKALLAVSMLALAGCSVSADKVPYQSYKIIQSYGVTSPDDTKAILDIFPIDTLDPGYTKEWDGFYKIMDGIRKKEYTVQDLSTLIQTSQSFHADDPANLLANPLFANRFNSDIIIPSARRVHRHDNIEDIILDNIRAEQANINARNQRKATEAVIQKKEEERQKKLSIISRFGQDIFDRCGGKIISFNTGFMDQDPYGYVGKCVVMQIPRFMPQQFGVRQWVGPNTLISTAFLGEVTNTFVVEADEHIKMGVPLVAIGVSPAQYQNGLGVLQTAAKFKVLRFY